MERRVLIAIVLSVVVLYGYQALFPPPAPPTPPASQPSGPPNAGSATVAPEPQASAAPATAAQAAPQPAVQPVVGETSERDIVLETNLVRAVFTNRGGRLKSWVLKSYVDEAGRPIDLVPHTIPPDLPLPFSLRVDEGGLTPRLNSALYRPTASPATGDQPPSVVFDYEDASGVKARKEFGVEPQTYVVRFSASVRQGDQELIPSIQWGPGLGDIGAASGGGSFFTGNVIQPPQAIFHNGESVERILGSGVNERPIHEAPFRFAGVDDHYFVAAAVNPGPARIEYRQVTVQAPGQADTLRQYVAHTIRLAKPPSGVRFYVGPKSFDELKAVEPEFVRVINFGMFAWLAVPFLSVLKWIYGYLGNYGWSIIALTILMNIVIFPLRHKSVVSMRKMQMIQPQLKAIQDRYKDLKVTDPARQKMNTEVMNLYREKGVNPASGCIPMVLTFPVLFAFYSLLSQAIELRGAPFGFWIRDLSLHDPYYVTPLLMGATMFLQQKMTPPSPDPTQQRMMMIMPIVFVAMFLRLPSGLAIYYFVNNLWAIGQQYFTNRLIGAPTVQTPRPAAERRLKSVGAGRTEGAERKS